MSGIQLCHVPIEDFNLVIARHARFRSPLDGTVPEIEGVDDWLKQNAFLGIQNAISLLGLGFALTYRTLGKVRYLEEQA